MKLLIVFSASIVLFSTRTHQQGTERSCHHEAGLCKPSMANCTQLPDLDDACSFQVEKCCRRETLRARSKSGTCNSFFPDAYCVHSGYPCPTLVPDRYRTCGNGERCCATKICEHPNVGVCAVVGHCDRVVLDPNSPCPPDQECCVYEQMRHI